MARYLKQHRRQLAGFAFPVVFLFLIGFMSFSIFPGWLKPTYGVPGAACSIPTGFTFGFSPDCDVCNGELCLPNSAANSSFQCGVLEGNIVSALATQDFEPTTNFSPSATAPQCPNGILAGISRFFTGQASTNEPDGLIYPECYQQCQVTTFTSSFTLTTLSSAQGTLGTFILLVPDCQPVDAFCQGISGGDTSNECRTAECVDQATPMATGNPTGCEYEYVDATENEDCQLCTDATEAGIPSCGNGVCEADESEDCASCPIDCLLPGFEANCPLTSGAVIADSCNPLPSPSPAPPIVVSGIVIEQGPPLMNLPGSLSCEDGDLCTNNACSADGTTCEATPKLPSGDTPDFCCPSGAVFPDSGSCGDLLGSNCDVDCYVPTECSVNVVELSGTGCGSSLTGMASPATASGAWAMFSMIALALPVALRKRS